MKKVIYAQEDIMPIVIGVLNYTSSCFMAFAYRAALDEHFVDLKGLVDPEELDQSAIDMVKDLDDPLNKLLVKSAEDICECCSTLSMITNFDLYDFMNDDHLVDLTNKFYQRLNFYCEANSGSSRGTKGDLYRFTFCVDHMLYHLCRLVVFGDRQVSRYSRKSFLDLKKADFSFFDSYEQYQVRILVELAHKLDIACDEIVRMVGKGRWKRRSLQ